MLDRLCLLVGKIGKERTIDKNYDLTSLTGLFVFMLLSRPKPNIEAKDLAWIDESNDFSDLNGYFKDSNVKTMVDIMQKHFCHCLKKKAARIKDIEKSFTYAIINFDCNDVESNLVRMLQIITLFSSESTSWTP
jgi:hypothetical protein